MLKNLKFWIQWSFLSFRDDDMVGGEEDAGFIGSAYLKRKKAEQKLAEEEAKLEKTPEELEEDRVAAKLERDIREDHSHVDLSLVLPKCKRIRRFRIMFGMQEVGLEYEPRFSECTWKDCVNLAKG